MLFEEGIEGGPVTWVHDEMALEVKHPDAKRASALLVTAMTDAFAEAFPGAPLVGLVQAHCGPGWASAKGA
jgi:hypothetical protein